MSAICPLAVRSLSNAELNDAGGAPDSVSTVVVELDFGLKEEPHRQIPDLDSFRRVWNDLDRGVAILPPETYRALAVEGLPMRVIREDCRRVAVARN